MKIIVKAKPRSHEQRVERIDATHFVVAVREAPADGKANDAVARALAEFFNIPFSQAVLLKGTTSRTKVFEIT